MGVAPALRRRPSGLYVPKDVRAERTLLRQDFMKLTRITKTAEGYGLVAMLACKDCRKGAAFDQETRTLECDCTRWRIR